MRRRILCSLVLLTLSLSFTLMATSAYAGVEWSILKNIPLDDTPRDVAVTLDGTTSYVLCDKSIQIVSMTEKKVKGSIPLQSSFSQIAVSPSGLELIVTDTGKKLVSIIEIFQLFNIPVGASPIIGPEKAPIIMTAFLDYQCPYCSKAYPLLEQVLAKHPQDVKLVIKHTPLKMHRFAENAAIAALAASRQNKYRELSALMMQNYSQLSEQTIRHYAQQIGLNMESFDSAIKDPELLKQVKADLQESTRCNVSGVPSIFINGRPIKSYTVESFSEMINEELRKKK